LKTLTPGLNPIIGKNRGKKFILNLQKISVIQNSVLPNFLMLLAAKIYAIFLIYLLGCMPVFIRHCELNEYSIEVHIFKWTLSTYKLCLGFFWQHA
jgi:hypothetical protein